MKRSKQLLSALAFGIGISGAAQGAVLYNNYTTNISSSQFPNNSWAADAFATDNHNYLLGNITLWVGATPSSGNGTLQIFNAGSNPDYLSDNTLSPTIPVGTPIGTMTLTGHINPFSHDLEPGLWVNSGSVAETRFTPQGNIPLSSNTTYWAKLTTTDPANAVIWAYDMGFAPGFFWANSDPGSGQFGAYLMKVEATKVSSVPVPAAVWLMGSALVALLGLARRKAE